MKYKNYFWFSRNTQIGLKLLFASLFLMLGNFIGAAVALLFPAFGYNFKSLAVGSGDDDEQALMEKIEKGTEKLVKKLTKENVTKQEVDKIVEDLNKDIAKLSNEGMKELNEKLNKMSEQHEALQKDLKEANDALKVQSGELKALKEMGAGAAKQEPVTLRKAIENAIKEAGAKNKALLTEKNDDYGQRLSLKDYFDAGNKSSPVFTIKAAVDMFQSSIVGANVNTVRLTDLDPQRVGIPLTIYPHVFDVFKSKSIKKPFMSLLVVYNYFDGAATKVEGAASGKSSFQLKTVEFKAFYIATNFVLSDETLDDLDEVLDEISTVAPDKIMDLIDSKLLGSAGDDVNDIAGILTAGKCTAYAVASGLGAGTVKTAYIVDTIASAKLQAENNKYKPNAIYLNPTDVALIAAKKNIMEDSLSDRRVQYDVLGNPVAVVGLRIIQSTAIVKNSFIVFDNNQPWIGKRADLTMEIGYNGTDLTEGQKTVIMKVRLAFGVRDKAGIIYCSDINAAIEDINQA